MVGLQVQGLGESVLCTLALDFAVAHTLVVKLSFGGAWL